MSPWNVELYEKVGGECPVADYLLAQGVKVRRIIQRELELVGEYGPQSRDTKQLAGKLWELRVHCVGGQHRILYFTVTGRVVVFLHAFLKKTEKTPRQHIDKAQRYMKEHLGRHKRGKP